MADQNGDVTIEDQPARERFVARVGDLEAELVYRASPDSLILIHTGVPPELEGHGVGGELVRAALARASSEHLTVVPWCPFARQWLRHHPEEASSVRIDWDWKP